MKTPQQLSKESIEFKVDMSFEETWKLMEKDRPELEPGKNVYITSTQLKNFVKEAFQCGATEGVKHFRIEHKILW